MLPWAVRSSLKNHGAALPTKHTELTPDLRRMVADSLKEDVDAFFGMLGRRIPAWADFA
jgi:hypothetical protein